MNLHVAHPSPCPSRDRQGRVVLVPEQFSILAFVNGSGTLTIQQDSGDLNEPTSVIAVDPSNVRRFLAAMTAMADENGW